MPIRDLRSLSATSTLPAPAGQEAWGGLWPGNFGGNMDTSDIHEGVTVYLPVFHDGGYFYFGDGHALQGDGEIVGSGLETTMDVTLQFDVIKGQKIAWPRIEDDTHIMVAGSIRPLVDAFRLQRFFELHGAIGDHPRGVAEALLRGHEESMHGSDGRIVRSDVDTGGATREPAVRRDPIVLGKPFVARERVSFGRWRNGRDRCLRLRRFLAGG